MGLPALGILKDLQDLHPSLIWVQQLLCSSLHPKFILRYPNSGCDAFGEKAFKEKLWLNEVMGNGGRWLIYFNMYPSKMHRKTKRREKKKGISRPRREISENVSQRDSAGLKVLAWRNRCD